MIRSAGSKTVYGPGHVLHFVAMFTGAPWQHAGFGIEGGQIYARTRSAAGDAVDTALAGDWTGTAHCYSIDWQADRVAFSIDGTAVATHLVPVSAPLRQRFRRRRGRAHGRLADDHVMTESAGSRAAVAPPPALRPMPWLAASAAGVIAAVDRGSASRRGSAS
jgi:hypothetical protein